MMVRMLSLLLLLGCRTPPVDVLLISLDGTGPELLEEELPDLPVLSGIAASGQHIPLWVEGPTVTTPAHALMLTGYNEAVNGVGTPADGYTGVIPRGMSIFERLGRRHPALRMAFVATKPSMIAIETSRDPFYRAAAACDVSFNEDIRTDRAGDQMIDALEALGEGPIFAFLHFGKVDAAGHRQGERSKWQREELHEIDEELGRIQAWVEGRDRDAVIYITTDHGFTPGEHEHRTDADRGWLITDDPEPLEGTLLRQLPWTVMARFGMDLEAQDPPAPLPPLWDLP